MRKKFWKPATFKEIPLSEYIKINYKEYFLEIFLVQLLL